MRTLFKDTKIGRIPDDWDAVEIGKLSKVVTGSTPSTKEEEYWGKDIPFITPTDIGDSKTVAHVERYLSHKGATVSRPIPPYSVCVTCIASIGKTCITKTASATNQQINSILPNEEFSSEYLYYMIVHNCERLKSFAGFTTVPIVKKSSFEKFLVALPPLPEQRKIAEILSTIDETIEKTDAIIHETQQLKKGLIQKLFTEGIGHIRFKETKIGRIEYGTIPVDWDEVELNSICNVTSSKRIMMHEYVDLGIPFYRSKEIIEKMRGISHDKILYISESRFREISRKFGAPQNGDILITAVGSLGVPYLIEDDERFYFKDGNLLWLRDFSEEIDKRFLIYYFESFGFKKVIEVITAGSSQKALTIEKLEKLRIPLPNSSEQKMITQILSEVDAKIEKEQDFKSELKQLKTGLMQVLLTGKARVKV